jgi:poly(A) polymerase
VDAGPDERERLDALLADRDLRRVLEAVQAGGARAWIVGGAVRDALLGKGGGDVDLATDALPERVVALAEAAGLRCVPTGLDHGTVTVLAGGRPFETTTLRRDVETDGRHAVVAFGTDLGEDARRRDFTVNALYLSPEGRLLDPVGGLADLRAGRVRFVGDAGRRIREDHLRALRYFRVHAWHGDPGAGLDPDALDAVAQNLDGLDILSRERVGQEVLRLLAAPDPAPAVAAMRATGALARVLPGAGDGLLAPLVHVEEAAGLPPDPLRRLAALGPQDGGCEPAEALRLSRAQAARLGRLRDGMGGLAPAHELGYRLGAEEAEGVLALRAAGENRELRAEELDAARDGAGRRFPVAGADLAGRFAGPALGERLRALEAEWLASGFRLTREDLLARA